MQPKGLGDLIATALTFIGLEPDHMERWLGRPCGCEERKERLNQLTFWARRVLAGKTDKAIEYLKSIVE